MLLLIGNDQFHISPTIIPSAPAREEPVEPLDERPLACRSSVPARLPSIAVPIAGIVERMPSGSHVLLLTHSVIAEPEARPVEQEAIPPRRHRARRVVERELAHDAACRAPGAAVIANQ